MVGDFNTQLFLNGALDFQQARVAELHHLFRLNVNEMVVLAELVGAFVLGAVVPKLVLDDQSAVQQQFDGVVERRPTDEVLVVLHLVVERVDVEMPVGGVDFLEDGKAFRRLAQFPLLKVFDEYLLDSQIGIVKRFFHFSACDVGAKVGIFFRTILNNSHYFPSAAFFLMTLCTSFMRFSLSMRSSNSLVLWT